MKTSDMRLQIGSVRAEDEELALRLVFGRFGDENPEELGPLLKSASSEESILLGAYSGKRLIGAAFAQIQPGKTVTVWPPRVTDEGPSSTALALLDAMTDRLSKCPVRIAQTLMDFHAQADADLLIQGGFCRSADLLYLVALDSQFPPSAPNPALEFQPYTRASHLRLTRIIDATYQQTLDCAELDGIRETEDVLAGYRSAGVFDPQWWLLVRHAGAEVGCLLMADHPTLGMGELVYMGLAPEARGRGWGQDIARHALWLAGQARRERLVVAVDAANTPALRMYSAVGFQEWDRRAAFLRIFPNRQG